MNGSARASVTRAARAVVPAAARNPIVSGLQRPHASARPCLGPGRAYRANATLARRVAAVWDFSCDASKDRMSWGAWYPPSSTPPDWWGVNIFSGNSLASSACVTSFVDAAEAARYPVMLGESTPRTLGVLDTPWSLVASGNDSATCIGVSGASTAGASCACVRPDVLVCAEGVGPRRNQPERAPRGRHARRQRLASHERAIPAAHARPCPGSQLLVAAGRRSLWLQTTRRL